MNEKTFLEKQAWISLEIRSDNRCTNICTHCHHWKWIFETWEITNFKTEVVEVVGLIRKYFSIQSVGSNDILIVPPVNSLSENLDLSMLKNQSSVTFTINDISRKFSKFNDQVLLEKMIDLLNYFCSENCAIEFKYLYWPWDSVSEFFNKINSIYVDLINYVRDNSIKNRINLTILWSNLNVSEFTNSTSQIRDFVIYLWNMFLIKKANYSASSIVNMYQSFIEGNYETRWCVWVESQQFSYGYLFRALSDCAVFDIEQYLADLKKWQALINLSLFPDHIHVNHWASTINIPELKLSYESMQSKLKSLIWWWDEQLFRDWLYDQISKK